MKRVRQLLAALLAASTLINSVLPTGGPQIVYAAGKEQKSTSSTTTAEHNNERSSITTKDTVNGQKDKSDTASEPSGISRTDKQSSADVSSKTSGTDKQSIIATSSILTGTSSTSKKRSSAVEKLKDFSFDSKETVSADKKSSTDTLEDVWDDAEEDDEDSYETTTLDTSSLKSSYLTDAMLKTSLAVDADGDEEDEEGDSENREAAGGGYFHPSIPGKDSETPDLYIDPDKVDSSVSLNEHSEWVDIDRGLAKFTITGGDSGVYKEGTSSKVIDSGDYEKNIWPTDYIIAIDLSGSSAFYGLNSVRKKNGHKPDHNLVNHGCFNSKHYWKSKDTGDAKYEIYTYDSTNIYQDDEHEFGNTMGVKFDLVDGKRKYDLDSSGLPRFTSLYRKNLLHYDETDKLIGWYWKNGDTNKFTLNLDDEKNPYGGGQGSCMARIDLYRKWLKLFVKGLIEEEKNARAAAAATGSTLEESKLLVFGFNRLAGTSEEHYVKPNPGSGHATSARKKMSKFDDLGSDYYSVFEQWIDKYKPQGLTDIKAALRRINKALKNDGTSGRRTKILFISDGTPTRNKKKSAIEKEFNKITSRDNTRIYGLGVGFGASGGDWSIDYYKSLFSQYYDVYSKSMQSTLVTAYYDIDQIDSDFGPRMDSLLSNIYSDPVVEGDTSSSVTYEKHGHSYKYKEKVITAQVDTSRWDPSSIVTDAPTTGKVDIDYVHGLITWHIPETPDSAAAGDGTGFSSMNYSITGTVRLNDTTRYKVADKKYYGIFAPNSDDSTPGYCGADGIKFSAKLTDGSTVDGSSSGATETEYTKTCKQNKLLYGATKVDGYKTFEVATDDTLHEIDFYLLRDIDYTGASLKVDVDGDILHTVRSYRDGTGKYTFDFYKWKKAGEWCPMVTYTNDGKPVRYYVAEDGEIKYTSLDYTGNVKKYAKCKSNWVADFMYEENRNDDDSYTIRLKNLNPKYNIAFSKVGSEIDTTKANLSGHPYLHDAVFDVYEWSKKDGKYHRYYGGDKTTRGAEPTVIKESSSASGSFKDAYVNSAPLWYTADNEGKFYYIESKIPEGYSPELDKSGNVLKHYIVLPNSYASGTLTGNNIDSTGSTAGVIYNLASHRDVYIHKRDFANHGRTVEGADFRVYVYDNASKKYVPYNYTDMHGNVKQVSVKEYKPGEYKTEYPLVWKLNNEGRFMILEYTAPYGYYPDFPASFKPKASSTYEDYERHFVKVTPGDCSDYILTNNGDKTYFFNKNAKQKLSIKKTDGLTNKGLEGADFRVFEWSVTTHAWREYTYVPKGAKVSRNVKFVYKGNGVYETDDYLLWTVDNEGSFYVQESQVPDGYYGDWINDSKLFAYEKATTADAKKKAIEDGMVKHMFTIDPGCDMAAVPVISATPATNTIKNYPTRQKISLKKLDSVTRQPLDTADFRVFQWSKMAHDWKEVVYTPAGATSSKVMKFVYKGNGVYESEDYLEFSADNEGRFYVQESKVPVGYYGDWINSDKLFEYEKATTADAKKKAMEDGMVRHTFSIKPGCDMTLVPVISNTTEKNTIFNQPIRQKISVTKLDSVTKQPLKDADFAVFQWSKLAHDWKEVVYTPAGAKAAKVMEFIYKGNGLYESEDYLEYTADNEGRFYIQESKVPEGYYGDWIDEDKLYAYEMANGEAAKKEAIRKGMVRHEFTIKPGCDIKAIPVISKTTVKNTIFNQPVRQKLAVTKLDSFTKKHLIGADFAVFQWSRREQKWNEVVYTPSGARSSKTMEFIYTGKGVYETENYLEYTADNQGKFYVQESRVPKGYYGDWIDEDSLLAYEKATSVDAKRKAIRDGMVKHEFTIKPGCDIKAIPVISAAKNNIIYNMPISQKLAVKKLDSVTKQPLDSADFAVYQWSQRAHAWKEVTYTPSNADAPKTMEFVYKGDGLYETEDFLTYTADNQGKFYVQESRVPKGFYGDWIDEDKLYDYEIANGDAAKKEAIRKGMVRHMFTIKPGCDITAIPVISEAENNVIYNQPIRQKISVNKIDSFTKKPLDNADFAVFQWSRRNQTWNEVVYTPSGAKAAKAMKFIKKGNGVYETEDYLEYTADNQGKFYVQESMVPKGYYGDWIDDGKLFIYEKARSSAERTDAIRSGMVRHEFTIKPGCDINANPVISMAENNTIINYPVRQKVSVTKLDSVTKQPLKDADFVVYQWSKREHKWKEVTYTPSDADAPKTMEFVYTGDGVYITEDYLEYTADNQGKFYVQESMVPKGYYGDWINEDKLYTYELADYDEAKKEAMRKGMVKHEFTIKPGCDITAIPVISEADGDNNTIYNYPIRQKLSVTKIDSFTKEPLDSADFRVFEWSRRKHKWNEITFTPSGAEAPKTMEFIYKGNGLYETEDYLEYTADNQGKFFVQESQVPDGYYGDWINSEKLFEYEKAEGARAQKEAMENGMVRHEFTIKPGCDVTKSPVISKAENNTIINYPIRQKLTVSKLDADTRVPLAGADFKVFQWSRRAQTWKEIYYTPSGADAKKLNGFVYLGNGVYQTEAYLRYTADSEGKFYVVETKVPANYYGDWISEEKAKEYFDGKIKMPDGMVKHEFTIKPGCDITATPSINKAKNNEILNIPLYFNVRVKKEGPVPDKGDSKNVKMTYSTGGLNTAWYAVRTLQDIIWKDSKGNIRKAISGDFIALENAQSLNSMDLSRYADMSTSENAILTGKAVSGVSGNNLRGLVRLGEPVIDTEKKAIVFGNSGISTNFIYETAVDPRTGDTGYINMDYLPAGFYEVVEVKAPTGYVRASVFSQLVECSGAGDTKEVIDTPVNFYNDYQLADPNPPTPTVEPSANKVASIRVTKRAEKALYKAGDDARYFITVTNTGELLVRNITLTDYFDGAEGVEVGTGFDLGVGETRTFEYEEHIASTVSGGSTFRNVAIARGTAVDPDAPAGSPEQTVEDRDDAKIGITDGDLMVLKEADRAVYKPGDTAYFTIRVINDNSIDLYNVVVTETLAGLNLIAPKNKEFSYDGSRVTVGTLRAGETAVLRFSYKIPKDYNGDEINNIVVARGEETEHPEPAVKVIKSADRHTVSAGDVVTYTVRVKNVGNLDLKDVVLTDSLGGIKWLEGSHSILKSLKMGEEKTVKYTYTVPSGTKPGTVIDNVITASSETEVIDSDGNKIRHRVTDSDDDRVVVSDKYLPHIKVTKTGAGSVAAPGEDYTYYITVTNDGDADLEDVSLADTLSGGVWADGYMIEQLLVGESVTLRYIYTMPAASEAADGDKVHNVVTVTAHDEDGNKVSDDDTFDVIIHDTKPHSNDDEESADVINPSIKVTKTADHYMHKVGDTIEFTIDVENTGNRDLTNVYLHDYLEDGWFEGAASDDVDGSIYKIGNLAMGEHKTVKFYFKAGSAYEGVLLTNYVQADGDSVPKSEKDPVRHVTDRGSADVSFGGLIGIRKKKVYDGAEVGVAGAEFTIYAAEEINDVNGKLIFRKDDKIETCVTDEVGYIHLANRLPLGKYYVKETKAPAGCQPTADIILLDASEYMYNQDVATLYVGGKLKDASIVVTLWLQDEFTRADLEGATLNITDSKGNVVTFTDRSGKECTTFTTVSTNKGYQINGLRAGEVYSINEISARDGYLNKVISISANGTGEIIKGAGSSYFQIRIPEVKTHANVDGSLDQCEYDVVFTNKPVMGHARLYKKGEILGSWNIIDKAVHFVKSVFHYIVGPIDQTKFKVIAREDIVHPDGVSGTLFRAGETVRMFDNDIDKDAIATTDIAGLAEFKGLYPGKYSFVEEKPKTGYLISASGNNVYNFTIAAGDGKNEYVPAAEGDITVYNDRQKATVEVMKYDSVSKNLIVDDTAEFGLYTAKAIVSPVTGETLIKKGKLLEKVETSEGIAKFESDLPQGKYYIKETKAPAGYELSDKKYSFKVGLGSTEEALRQIIIKVYDEPEHEEPETPAPDNGLYVHKAGGTAVQAGGDINYSIDSVQNNAGKAVANFTLVDALPSMTALKTLTTGTYNDPSVKLNVYYKASNSSDWKSWVTGISGTESSTLDTASLGLKDAYVTSFMITYAPGSTVPAGFRNMTPITYTAKVSKLVQAGTVLTNTVRITATNEDGTGKYESSSSAGTNVPGTPSPLLPSPKTGDTANIILYAVLAVGSLMGLIVLALIGRKDKDILKARGVAAPRAGRKTR